MSIINSIPYVIVTAILCYLIQLLTIKLYFQKRYGKGYEKFYADASITKFNVLGKQLRRNNRIKMFVSFKDTWYEGTVIGLTVRNEILIRNDDGDIIGYRKDKLIDGEVVLLS